MHVIDHSCYRYWKSILNGAVDEELSRWVGNNVERTVRRCTVRCWDVVGVPTEGWKVYPGCPSIQNGLAAKRKMADDATRGRGARGKSVMLTDHRIHEIVRKYLLKHSANYSECSLEIRNYKNEIRTFLKGHGETFCKNRLDDSGGKEGSHHTSNRAWMLIYKDGAKFKSVMKCFCPKHRPTVSGQPCNAYTSNAYELDQMDAGRLFPTGSAAPNYPVFFAQMEAILDQRSQQPS